MLAVKCLSTKTQRTESNTINVWIRSHTLLLLSALERQPTQCINKQKVACKHLERVIVPLQTKTCSSSLSPPSLASDGCHFCSSTTRTCCRRLDFITLSPNVLAMLFSCSMAVPSFTCVGPLRLLTASLLSALQAPRATRSVFVSPSQQSVVGENRRRHHDQAVQRRFAQPVLLCALWAHVAFPRRSRSSCSREMVLRALRCLQLLLSHCRLSTCPVCSECSSGYRTASILLQRLLFFLRSSHLLMQIRVPFVVMCRFECCFAKCCCGK